MKRKLLAMVLSLAMVMPAAGAAITASAAKAMPEVSKAEIKTAYSQESVTGRIRFDIGSWNHDHIEKISFYIQAKKADGSEQKFGSNVGWNELNNWCSKKTFGTPVEGEDGIVESYDIEFEDDWNYSIIFYDAEAFDSQYETYEFSFTKDDIGKTAYVTNKTQSYPEMPDRQYPVVAFKEDVGGNPTDTSTDTPEIKLGDVNNDGKVTAKDAMLIQRYAVHLIKLDDTQLKAADVNGDGKVTNKDALAILRFTIGYKIEGLA